MMRNEVGVMRATAWAIAALLVLGMSCVPEPRAAETRQRVPVVIYYEELIDTAQLRCPFLQPQALGCS
jgi:hypothetical protein